MENRHWVLRQWKTDTGYYDNGKQTQAIRTMDNKHQVPEQWKTDAKYQKKTENRHRVQQWKTGARYKKKKKKGKRTQGTRKMENGHRALEQRGKKGTRKIETGHMVQEKTRKKTHDNSRNDEQLLVRLTNWHRRWIVKYTCVLLFPCFSSYWRVHFPRSVPFNHKV